MQKVDISNFKNKKTALVLSGGVVKSSAWHLGVGLALSELGFTFKHNHSLPSSTEISTYVGSSAGSLMNLYFASGYSPHDIVDSVINRSNKKLKAISYSDMICFKKTRKKPPKSFIYDPFEKLPFAIKHFVKPWLGISGFFTTEKLRKYVKDHVLISNNFEDYKADMFVVATQLDHSRKVIFSKYKFPNPKNDPAVSYYMGTNVSEAVAATMSVPPIYSPYPIENPLTGQIDYYIDGEIRDTLSTHVAIDNKCEYIISSWTHTPYHFHDEIGSLVSYGLPAILLQTIYLIIQKKIKTDRKNRQLAKDVVETVNDFLKENKFSPSKRSELVSILETKLDHKSNVHLIDIFPKHHNYKVFFRGPCTLNPNKTSEIVTCGYKRTLEIFRHHEWES
ncbi:MAG: patatin-like phospholipase family protein [Bacteriovoracaceae bacterium]|nr:patatin-like phospholipase family protein [Bacteriovoracaceae bacterium]